MDVKKKLLNYAKKKLVVFIEKKKKKMGDFLFCLK